MTEEAQKLVDIRNELGLTQSQLAQLIGVHAMTVSKWERGAARMSMYQFQMLCVFGKATISSRWGPAKLQYKLRNNGIYAALGWLLTEGTAYD